MQAIPVDQVFPLPLPQQEQEPLDEIEQQLNQVLEIVRLLSSCKKECQVRLTLSLLEFVLVLVALIILPTECAQTSLLDYFTLAVAVSGLQSFLRVYMNIIVTLNLKEVLDKREMHELPYPLYGYTSNAAYFEAVRQHHHCYRFFRYVYFILELCFFIFAQISLYQNLTSQCQIGQSKYNYTWGIAFYFIIVRYIGIGVPVVAALVYLLAAPFIYLLFLSNQDNRQRGASEEKLNQLEHKVVEGKLGSDNECIICLQEFVMNEEYVRLKCHPDHVYHKVCIVDWLKVRADCPKCRAEI